MRWRGGFAAILVCALLLTFASQSSFGQAKTSSGTQGNGGLERLARKADWGELSLRLFPDVHNDLAFTLATSWIPGEDRKGMFRYRVEVHAGFDPKNPITLDTLETLLKRADACNLYLRLMDGDDFELRDIALIFNKTVNSDTMLIGLSANSSEPMSATEYRSFIGIPHARGSWTITWSCPDSAPK